MDFTETQLSRDTVYKGKVINVHSDKVELSDGSTSYRDLVEYIGAVGILPITKENNVIMVKQFRYGAGKMIYEIPAGTLEVDENPEHCAKRELIEETGYKAENLKYLTQIYTTPAYSTEIIKLYVAENLEYIGQNLDEDEFIEVVEIPMVELLQMCLNGEIADSKTLVSVYAYNMQKGLLP